jgi:YVTN family beta-propeller protein
MDLISLGSKKKARLPRTAAVVAILAICTSCGDTFRPVAIPVTPNPPDPASLHFAVIISQNATLTTSNPGSSSRIDVSGDTNVGVARVGLGPVHGTLTPDGTRLYIANREENTVSLYSPSDSTNVLTITLPSGSNPNFVHTTQTDTVYVANLGDGAGVTPNVAAITTSSNIAARTIPVGANPVAMAETPDGKKLYVVNQGSGNVTAINTVDKSVSATIPTGTGPVWAAARSDSNRVYVLDQPGGSLYVIDTFSDSVLGAPVAVGSNANYLFYNGKQNRLYVTAGTPNAPTLAVFDASVDPPAPLPTIDLASAANAPCTTPCTVGSVTALPDGSRAYIVTYADATCAAGETAPCIATKVSVVRTSDNSIQKTLSVDPGSNGEVPAAAVCDSARFRRFIASAADSTRVYVSNCDAGSTAVIRTSDDSKVLDLKAPFGTPDNSGDPPPPQNPVFIIAGR